MSGQPYQLLPPLSGEEYAALRADIETHGVRVPVDVDEHGHVLDGHHRQQIAAELGINCPVRVVAGLTEEEKRHHAVAVNAHRRQLTRAQRRDLVVAELERDPARSDRAIGRIVGVDHKTVGAIRRGGWGIPHPEEPGTETDRPDLNEVIQGGGIDGMDRAILYALSNQVDPMLIVGWLTTGMYAMAALHEAEDFRVGVRSIFESRIRMVLDEGSALTAELAGPDLCRKPLEPSESATLAAAISLGAA